MSCNGCRVLRKGCSETCVLRQCLKCIDSPEAQANATLFVTKFFGRAGLTGFINGVPESQRPALFQSLLYEACGRTVNPVHGAVGLLYSGNWHLCQAAVETVLRGGSLKPANINGNPNTQSKLFPSSCRRDTASPAAAQESSSFTSDGSLKALQSNIQPFIDFSSGCSSEAVAARPSPVMSVKRMRSSTKQEVHGTAEDVMAKQPRSWYASEVHAKQQTFSNGVATAAGHDENDVIAMTDRFDVSENGQQAQNAPKLGSFNQSTLVAPVARRARPGGLPSHSSIIVPGRQDHEAGLMVGCSQGTVLDHDRSTISSDSGDDHCHSIELDLSLKAHPVLCHSPEKHDAPVLRVSSPSVNSESSVTGLHDSGCADPQSDKQELKLLHLLV